MTEANYSILRYIPDPMRNEPINIGIVVWSGDIHEVLVDREALSRVLAANPALDKASFDNFPEYIAQKLQDEKSMPARSIDDRLRSNLRFPIEATEAIYTSLEQDVHDDEHLRSLLFDEAGALSSLLVRPRKRTSGTRRSSPQVALRRRLLVHIENKRVYEHFEVKGKNTGDAREISFFANSGVNVALVLCQASNAG